MDKKNNQDPNKVDIGIKRDDIKPEIDTDFGKDKDTGVGEDLRPDIEKQPFNDEG